MFTKGSLFALVICATAYQAVAAITGAQREIILKELQTGLQCAIQYKLSKEMLVDIMKTYTLPSTDDTKCFAHCILTRLQMMGDDGNINWDKAFAIERAEYEKMKTEEEKAHKIGELCQKQLKKQDDKCETAYTAMKCFLDNGNKAHLRLFGFADLEDSSE